MKFAVKKVKSIWREKVPICCCVAIPVRWVGRNQNSANRAVSLSPIPSPPISLQVLGLAPPPSAYGACSSRETTRTTVGPNLALGLFCWYFLALSSGEFRVWFDLQIRPARRRE